MWLLCVCYFHISTPNFISISISALTSMSRSGERENEYMPGKIWCGHIPGKILCVFPADVTFPQPDMQCTRHQGCEHEPHIILTQFRS